MKNYNKMYNEPEFETTEFIDVVEEPAPDPAHLPEELGKVNAREVYIREAPFKDSEHLGTVKRDDCLIVLGRENDFLKIETQDGVHAYIMEQFVDIVN